MLVHNKRFTPDQQAAVDLAKEAKRKSKTKNISQDDAQTILDWANEYGLPNRGPESHPNRPHGKNKHIHVGPVDHIFCN